MLAEVGIIAGIAAAIVALAGWLVGKHLSGWVIRRASEKASCTSIFENDLHLKGQAHG